MEAHPAAVEACTGAMETHTVAMEVYIGAVKVLSAWSHRGLPLKVHKIENFFDSDFGICVIYLLVMSKY